MRSSSDSFNFNLFRLIDLNNLNLMTFKNANAFLKVPLYVELF
jgi:hypothetical protein